MLKEVGKTVVLVCPSTKAAWITWMGTRSPPSHSDPSAASCVCVAGGGQKHFHLFTNKALVVPPPRVMEHKVEAPFFLGSQARY